jgi:hypothetical protein
MSSYGELRRNQAKVMAITDYIQEFLRIFIQEISKNPNFGPMENSNTHKMKSIVFS